MNSPIPDTAAAPWTAREREACHTVCDTFDWGAICDEARRFTPDGDERWVDAGAGFERGWKAAVALASLAAAPSMLPQSAGTRALAKLESLLATLHPEDSPYQPGIAALCASIRASIPSAQAVPPGAESANLNTLGKLVQRLSESQPQQWCLIGPTGLCHLGPDPLVLAAQATVGRL